MPENLESVGHTVEQINLKHRITGAAVLIFFGILVLPWLLGPPSEAQKDDHSIVVAAEDERHSTFEEEVLSTLQETDESFNEPEETVYVSKITPVDGGAAIASIPVKVGSTSNSGTLSNSDTPSKKIEKPVNDSLAKEKADPSTITSNQAISQDLNTKPDPAVKAAKTAVDNQANKPKNPPSSTANDAPSADEKAVNKPTDKTNNKIDVGWVVQVELLTDKAGAERLVDQLSEKGFQPHTTVVDTNRGKKTGTRIWLGPFEQRAQAGAENERLETKMGKRGFVRVYP